MQNPQINARLWWLHQRMKFNKGLVVSGMLAFIIYTLFTSQIFGSPDFAATLDIMMVELVVYLLYMLMANLFYGIGWLSDLLFNTTNNQSFRDIVFDCGYWFAVCLPVLFIIMVLSYS